MHLHQMQVNYHAGEDRILVRISFAPGPGEEQGKEMRAWLTRRLVKLFWPGLMNALQTKVTLDKPQAAHASPEIVQMQHQAIVHEETQSGKFTKSKEPLPQIYPTHEEPALVVNARFAVAPNQPVRIHFQTLHGDGFQMNFSDKVLHAFCNLLQNAVKHAQWEMALSLPGMAEQSVENRTLN